MADAHPLTMTIDDRGNVLRRCDIGSAREGFRCLQVGRIDEVTLARMKAIRDDATKGDFISPAACTHCRDCNWSAIDLYRPTIVGMWSTILASGGERCARRDSVAAEALVSWFVAVDLQAGVVGVQLWPEAGPCGQQPPPPLMFGYRPCELPAETQVSRLSCPPSAGLPTKPLFEVQRFDGRSSQTLMIDRNGYVWRVQGSTSSSEPSRSGSELVGRVTKPWANIVGLTDEVRVARLVRVDGACEDCGSSTVSAYLGKATNERPTVLARDGHTREVRDCHLARAVLGWLLAVSRDVDQYAGDARYIGEPGLVPGTESPR